MSDLTEQSLKQRIGTGPNGGGKRDASESWLACSGIV